MALNDARFDTVEKTKGAAEATQTKTAFATGSNEQVKTGNTVNANDDLFGMGFFVSGNENSEYVKQFSEKASEVMVADVTKKGLEAKSILLKLDNSTPQFSMLSYSCVVVATKSNLTEKIFYHIFVLEATGDKPLHAAQILDINKQNPNLPVYVASDAFNKTLKDVVTEVLAERYSVNVNMFESTNGSVVPYIADAEVAATEYVNSGVNANIAKIATAAGIIKPVVIGDIVKGNNLMQIDITYTNGTSIDVGSKPVRNDFKLGLNIVPAANTQIKALNQNNSGRNIGTTFGYLETVIKQDPPQYVGQTPVKKVAPAVILTQFSGIKPTIDMSILGILNSAVFTNPNHMAQLLLNSPRDFGLLNYLINLEGNKNGYGAKLKTKGKMSQDKIIELYGKLFDASPLVFVEIEAYGPNFDVNAPFAALHYAGINKASNDYIIKVCEDMFGSKMENRVVTQNEGFLVPTGVYTDASGALRDIRDVDTAFVMEHAKDPSYITKWTNASVPASVSGVDPLLTRIEVINHILPDAIITGKATRVLLNPAWLAEVIAKSTALGYTPTTDVGSSNFTFGINDMSAVNTAYTNAALKNVQFGGGAQRSASGLFTPQTNFFART